MKPENLRSWTIPIRHLSDVPVSRNWYKTVSNLYENSYICIFYKSFSIKQIIFSKSATNLKTTSLRISDYNFYFYSEFLIDIIDNIITYSPYSLYYVTRTSANDSAVSLSCDTDGNHVTRVLNGHWLKFWWRNTDYTDCNNIINYNY